MIYKVSYVDETGQYPGSIKNQPVRPQIGDRVKIGTTMFRVTAVHEIMPPRDNFLYLHAAVKQDESPAEEPAR